MKVNGKEVEQATIDSCIARMKQREFKSMEIELLCVRMGIDRYNGDAMRVADRVIQRERKAGNIVMHSRPYWCWVGDKKVAA